jgi:carbamoylphosphate synthase large subunit
MAEAAPLTFLCITTYEKGQEFMRECKRQGCRVFLLTAESLRQAEWPRESLDDSFYMPVDLPLPEIVKAMTYLAREKKIDRIVALDEFDMETAATLREHMRIPGMGLTTMRYFRDKLAMRMQALEHGIRVPDFIPVLNHDDIRYYLSQVTGPWVLKPRSEASAIGIKLIDTPEALWPILDSLGDQQSSFLLEKFLPGDVYHVDSVVSEQEVVFSSVSRYGQPPMAVAQQGGIFTTYLLPGNCEEATALRTLNRELIQSLGLVRGVSRVGGAYISEMVEIATGINLWREWARIEIASGKEPYQLPAVRGDYAGLILSLARQEHPDTSAYDDPEIALRLKRRHHAGLVLRSSDPARIQLLLENYSRRFAEEFLAIEPPGTKPAA